MVGDVDVWWQTVLWRPLRKSNVQPLDRQQRKRQMVKPLGIPIRRRAINALATVARPPTFASTHRGDELVPLGVVGEAAQAALGNDALQLRELVWRADGLCCG